MTQNSSVSGKPAGRKAGEACLALVLGILLAISAMGIAFAIDLSAPVVHVLASKYSADSAQGRTHDDLVVVAEEMRAYVAGSPDSGLPIGDDYHTAFDGQAMMHMDAVRDVFHAGLVIAAIAIVASAALWSFCWWKGYRNATSYGLAVGGVLPVIFLVVVGGLALIDFNAVFSEAHVLLFNNLNWIFPDDSLMCLATPLDFWEAASVLFCVVLLVIAVIYCAVGHVLHKKTVAPARQKASGIAPEH